MEDLSQLKIHQINQLREALGESTDERRTFGNYCLGMLTNLTLKRRELEDAIFKALVDEGCATSLSDEEIIQTVQIAMDVVDRTMRPEPQDDN